MKLFLASLASETLDLVIPLLKDDPKNVKVAFIPTAADPYREENISWIDADWDKLISMGFSVTKYDIKAKNIEVLRRDLAEFQVIFVAGGNTFYLLDQVKKSGFDILLSELLSIGVVYIGSSAGSMILGRDIAHLSVLDHADQFPEILDYTGLNLIEQRLVPHFGREKYASIHSQLQKEWGDKIIFICDDQALMVNDDKIELVTK